MGIVSEEQMSGPAERSDDPLLRMLELDLRGDNPYPSGTTFVRADISGFDRTLRRLLLERTPTVVVFPDGRERFIDPRAPLELERPLLRRVLRFTMSRLQRR